MSLSVKHVLDEAERQLDEFDPHTSGAWPHASATLIRQRTLEQGLDPRDFVIYAYGGAGPLHAWGFSAELGAGEVVIPLGNGAATLSAFGIAAGDLVQHHEVIRFEDPHRIFDEEGAHGALVEARAAGKLRFVGFTGHKDPHIHLHTLRVAEEHGFRDVSHTLEIFGTCDRH